MGQPLVCIARAKWHRRRPADACTPSAVIPMKLLSILLTVAVFGDGMPKANEDRYLETIRVSENVYVFKPKIDWVHGNGVASIGPEGIFFIDTYPQFNYAEEAIRRLKRSTKLPVRVISRSAKCTRRRSRRTGSLRIVSRRSRSRSRTSTGNP